MGNLNNKNYISLQEAVKHCTYSQEYLSLRARQGKLRSIKIGRNWVTTREWLDDYIGKAEEYIETQNNKRLKQKKKFPGLQVRFVKIEPPKNLPIEKTPILRLSLGLALIVTLILSGGVLGKEGITDFLGVFSGATEEVLQNLIVKAKDFKIFVQEKKYETLAQLSDSFFLFSVDLNDSFREKAPILVRNILKTEGLKVQFKQVNGGGVTMYDRVTSQPYCIYIEYGKMYTSPGKCLDLPAVQPFAH